MILPRKNQKLRDIVLNKKVKGKTDEKIIKKLTQLINIELSYVNKLAMVSEKLRNLKEYTTYEVFLLIDLKNEKYLNNSNISNFMNKQKSAYLEDDINDIIFRLYKLERKSVSYEDFQVIFNPVKVLRSESSINNDRPNSNYRDIGNSELSANQDQVSEPQAESNFILEQINLNIK